MGYYVRIKERHKDYEPPAHAFALCYGTGLAFVVVAAAASVIATSWQHALTAIVIAALYALTTPVLWRLGDKLRRYTMPTGYYVKASGDLIWEKLYWTIGPQCLPMIFYCLASGLVVYNGLVARH